MDLNQQKEQFSRAWVQAIAAVAGFGWSTPSVDDDSIDLTLHQTGGRGTTRSPKLDLQLKCKTDETPLGDFSFLLKIKNYDDLRCTDVMVPRILVIVLVPNQPSAWVDHAADGLTLRRCGYWLSLRGLPDCSNSKGLTIKVPHNQTFTVGALQAMMNRIGQGGLP